jgi:hypothetical protein
MLGLRTTQASRFLIRLHCRLRGELQKHADGQDALVTQAQAARDLATVEAALVVLGTPTDFSALRPVKHWPKVAVLGYGEIRTGVLKALRHNKGWMTYRDLASSILERRGVGPLPRSEMNHFVQKVREATHILNSRGLVECELAEAELELGVTTQRWRIRPR